MTCVLCNKASQLPLTLKCNDVYCFLCLKDYCSKASPNPVCVKPGCGQPIDVDLDHVSKDFRTLLSSLQNKNVWLYSSASNDGWWMYNPDTVTTIENCYNSNLPTCSFLIGSKTYRISFRDSLQSLVTGNVNNATQKQRPVKRVTFTKDMVEQINIKGIAGMYFKTIEDEIGKFV